MKILIISILTAFLLGILTFGNQSIKTASQVTLQLTEDSHPLQVLLMRQKSYPGSEITIEETLAPSSNYNQYIASYLSEGLKIYALMTVPTGQVPEGGWPVIIFNHGYIPPEQYQTNQRYEAYVNSLARSGFIVFKPDYRGNGNSEGQPEGAYYSPAYTTDILNAVSSIRKYQVANPDKIGMWGHSLGGNITLRAMVISKDIKAGVIWGGVIGSYSDLMNRWRRNTPWRPSEREQMAHRPGRQNLIDKYGDPEQNPKFWQSIDPTFFVSDISGPLQLHHGENDQTVPWEFSQNLKEAMEKAGKTVEYYSYQGGDHNLSSPSFEPAMQRTISFFNTFLK